MSRTYRNYDPHYNTSRRNRKRKRSTLRDRKNDDRAYKGQLSSFSYSDLQYHVGRCKTKVAYDKETQALAAARSMESKHEMDFDTYICPFCGKWHVTKNPWVEE